MTKKAATPLFPQRTAGTRYSSRYVQRFAVRLPVEKIDLYKWITEMTDADYAAYSKAHQAMGSYYEGKIFRMKNVENIGIETLVQRYELKYHAPNHIQFYSSASTAYIMRWFPAKVGVPWEMYLEPVAANSSLLYCLIGVDYPGPLLKMAAWFSSLGGLFLKKHLRDEGNAFARDLELKFKH